MIYLGGGECGVGQFLKLDLTLLGSAHSPLHSSTGAAHIQELSECSAVNNDRFLTVFK